MAIFSMIGGWLAYAGGYLAAAAGLSFSTAVMIGNAVGYLGMAAAASAVSRALAPRPNIPRSEIQAIINQTEAPRRVYVGENLVGGIRAFFDVRAGVLYQLVLVNHGPIHAFREFRIDGNPVAVDGVGQVQSGVARGYVQVDTRNGTGQGGDYVVLLRDRFPDLWPASRRLDGQATFLVLSGAPNPEDFQRVFPKSYNTTYQWVIEGQAIRDPRTGQTAYGDNAALVIAHYLTHADGYRLALADLHPDSVSAMADVADLPVPQRGGGTAPSLRLWGYWTLDEEPSAVIARMRISSGIRPYETQDGRVGLIGGPLGEPACTLTAKDIRSIRVTGAVSEREGFNVLGVFFLSAAHNYEIVEAEAWRDEARLAQEGEIAQEFRAEMCPDLSQARRLAQQAMDDGNRGRVEIITNLVGLKARFPRHHGQRHTILLDYRPEDGSGRVIEGEFEVLDHEFDPVGMECRIVLAPVVRRGAWNPADEGEPPAPLPIGGGDPPPPMSASLGLPVITTTGGQQQSVIEVVTTPVSGRGDLVVQGRYRPAGSSDSWIAMTSDGWRARSGAIEDGATYEVEARWLGVFDGVDPWRAVGTITVVVDSTPPGPATNVIASRGFGPINSRVTVTWVNPDTPFWQVRVYREAGNISGFANATLRATVGGAEGQISEYNDPSSPNGQRYRYWIVPMNASGVEATPAPSPIVPDTSSDN